MSPRETLKGEIIDGLLEKAEELKNDHIAANPDPDADEEAVTDEFNEVLAEVITEWSNPAAMPTV